MAGQGRPVQVMAAGGQPCCGTMGIGTDGVRVGAGSFVLNSSGELRQPLTSLHLGVIPPQPHSAGSLSSLSGLCLPRQFVPIASHLSVLHYFTYFLLSAYKKQIYYSLAVIFLKETSFPISSHNSWTLLASKGDPDRASDHSPHQYFPITAGNTQVVLIVFAIFEFTLQ